MFATLTKLMIGCALIVSGSSSCTQRQTLIAVKTRGDGNCLFYSTWLQLFEGYKNFAVARGMHLLVLYKLQKDKARLRRYPDVDGADQYDREVL